MNKDREFENILEECLERMLAHGDSVEQCTQLHPEYAEQLKPLLTTAASVNRAVDVTPSAEYKARAAYQMRCAMGAATPTHSRSPSWRWQPRWAMAAGIAVTVLVIGTGTIYASGSSIPGNPLYAVKLTAENVRLQFAGTDIQKAELYTQFADKRMTEITQLVEKGRTQKIDSVAQRFDDTVTTMSNLSLGTGEQFMMLAAEAPSLTSTADATGGKGIVTAPGAVAPAPATAPPTTTEVPPDMLAIPAPAPVTAPEKAATPEIARDTPLSQNTATYGVDGTRSMDTGISKPEDDENDDKDDLTGREKLRKDISNNAVNHPEKLRRLLESDKVPESTKLAIRRAIWAAENGYKKALEQLGR